MSSYFEKQVKEKASLKKTRIRNYLLLLLIISLCVGCHKEADIHLIYGQTLVEITDRNHIVFEESLLVNERSYKGKTFEQYVKGYYHSNYQALQLSNSVFDVITGDLLDAESTQIYKDSIIVDINNYDIKDAPIYVYVPGTINLLLSSDSKIEYELVNDSTLKVIDWHNESSVDIVFTTSEAKNPPKLKGNYVLFDYQNIHQLNYEEKISIELEALESENVGKTLKEWMEDHKYENYTQLQNTFGFKSVLTNDKVSIRLLKKYSHAYTISLGDIKTETYLRVPKEILFISSGTKFTVIDDRTLLIKKGAVTIIYK